MLFRFHDTDFASVTAFMISSTLLPIAVAFIDAAADAACRHVAMPASLPHAAADFAFADG